MGRITVIQDGVCLYSDNEIIRKALLHRCRQLEVILAKRNMTENERKVLRDEYERTFSLTEKYQRGEPP